MDYFKNKRELTFLAIGILMLFIVASYSGYAINFLFHKINAALAGEKAPQLNNLRFQLEKSEVLLRK